MLYRMCYAVPLREVVCAAQGEGCQRTQLVATKILGGVQTPKTKQPTSVPCHRYKTNVARTAVATLPKLALWADDLLSLLPCTISMVVRKW